MKDSIRIVRKSSGLRRRMVQLKSIEDAFQEGKPERTWLLQQLSGLVNYARTRVMDSITKPDERVKWSRILVSAAIACSYALKDKEIDQLKDEVGNLKKLVKEIEDEYEEERVEINAPEEPDDEEEQGHAES